MKNSTKFWYIILSLIFILLIIKTSGFILLFTIPIIFIYLLICILEIVYPYKREIYGNEYFEYAMLKAKNNIIQIINNLIDKI